MGEGLLLILGLLLECDLPLGLRVEQGLVHLDVGYQEVLGLDVVHLELLLSLLQG